MIRGGASSPERAAFGSRVAPGDQLVTGRDGRVRFLLDGKAVVALQPESRLSLEPAALHLASGGLGVGVAGGLLAAGEGVLVQTPNAAARLAHGSLSAGHVPAERAEAARGVALLAAGSDAGVAIRAGAAPEGRTGFYLLSGEASVQVTGQPPLPLGSSQGIAVTGSPTLAQVAPYGGPGPADAIQATPARQPRRHREEPGLSLQMGAATLLAGQLLASIPTLSSVPLLASLPPRPAEPIGPALKDPPRPLLGQVQPPTVPAIPPTPPTPPANGGSGGGAVVMPVVTLEGGSGSPDGALYTVQGKTSTWEQELLRIDGGTMIVFGGEGPILRLVDSLLTATQPIVTMLGGTLDVTLDAAAGGLVELVGTQASFRQGGFLVDRGFLKIQDVPLLSVGPGSSVTVGGDFLAALNGAQITVLRAPLISVNGGTLDIAGALASFGGSGGSQLVISNSLASTATLSGVPVRTDATSTVSIGPNPFPGLGTLGTVNITGSAILATGGGSVSIAAPATPLPVVPPTSSGTGVGTISITSPPGAVMAGNPTPSDIVSGAAVVLTGSATPVDGSGLTILGGRTRSSGETGNAGSLTLSSGSAITYGCRLVPPGQLTTAGVGRSGVTITAGPGRGTSR